VRALPPEHPLEHHLALGKGFGEDCVTPPHSKQTEGFCFAKLLTGRVPERMLPTGMVPTRMLPMEIILTGMLPMGMVPTGMLPMEIIPTGMLPMGTVNRDAPHRDTPNRDTPGHTYFPQALSKGAA